MAKKTQTQKTPARRGRPSSFPGVETVSVLSRIPVENRDQLREIAEKREEPINVTLARLIEQGHRAAMRTRSKRKAASTETAAE